MADKKSSGRTMGAPFGRAAKAAARRAGHRPRKKRTRPEPRQHTIADLDRAQDRVEAAERRLDSDRTNHRAGIELERARLKLRAIEANLRKRGLLK